MSQMLKTAAVNETRLYELVLELSQKVRVAKGVLETVRLIERGRAKVVLIALNVSPQDHLAIVEALCEEKSVPIIFVSRKEDLGKVAGLEVSASCIALPLPIPVESNIGR
jgi:ribosomal protein L7Ae-like RNA K-turn-binding protein